MKALRLKEQFKGMTLTKNNPFLGCSVTFNALMVPIESYVNYYKAGFEFLFDIVDVEIEPQKKSKIKISTK